MASKGYGSSRSADKAHSARVNSGTSPLHDGLDNWDGSVLKDSGSINVRLSPVVEGLPKGSKAKNDAIDVRDAIIKDLSDRGFPLEVLGEININIAHKGSIVGAGGQASANGITVIVSSSKEYAIRTAYHEIGHKIHDLYFPKWNEGDTNYDSSDKQAKAYTKSPREAFANRFRDEILKQPKVSNIASVIKRVKKSVDADVASGKLNPINEDAWKQAFDKVNNSKQRAHLVKRENGIGYDKVYVGKKVQKVVNGKLITIAQSKEK